MFQETADDEKKSEEAGMCVMPGDEKQTIEAALERTTTKT